MCQSKCIAGYLQHFSRVHPVPIYCRLSPAFFQGAPCANLLQVTSSIFPGCTVSPSIAGYPSIFPGCTLCQFIAGYLQHFSRMYRVPLYYRLPPACYQVGHLDRMQIQCRLFPRFFQNLYHLDRIQVHRRLPLKMSPGCNVERSVNPLQTTHSILTGCTSG